MCVTYEFLGQGKGERPCAYSSSESMSLMTRRFFAGALTSSNWNSSSSSSFGVLPVWYERVAVEPDFRDGSSASESDASSSEEA